MNKHTKFAIFLAPFLLIGGYVLADFFVSSKDTKVYELSLQDKCLISGLKEEQACYLSVGDFALNMFVEENELVINTNYALTDVVLFTAEQPRQPYLFEQKNNAFYWKNNELYKVIDEVEKLRIIITENNRKYIGEFTALKTKAAVNHT